LWRLFKNCEIAEHARYFDLERTASSARAVPAKPKRATSRKAA